MHTVKISQDKNSSFFTNTVKKIRKRKEKGRKGKGKIYRLKEDFKTQINQSQCVGLI